MYISQSLLITALGYERGKQVATERSEAVWNHLKGQVVAVAEQYDKNHQENIECTGDILCQRSGRRHKADCIGRDVPFMVYARELS